MINWDDIKKSIDLATTPVSYWLHFAEDTGKVFAVSNKKHPEDTNLKSIEITADTAKPFISGKKLLHEIGVTYDIKLREYVILYEDFDLFYNRASLLKITANSDKTPDCEIIYNTKKSYIEIKLSNDVKQSLTKNEISLDRIINFYFTEKNNPNKLYGIVDCALYSLMEDSVKIPVNRLNFKLGKSKYSCYTVQTFASYKLVEL